MTRGCGQILKAIILACLLAGCGRDVRPDYPQVPLLISKRPVEQKPEDAVAALLPQEPTLPTPPPSSLVWTPPDFEKYVRLVKRSKPPKPAGEGSAADTTALPEGPSLPPPDESTTIQRLPEPVPLPVLPPTR